MTATLVPFSRLTEPEFLRVFNRLMLALGGREDDTGVTQDVYFEALKDLSLEALDAGALALMKEPGRKWFPTTAEWRTAATQAQDAALRQTLSHRDEPWHLECEDCADTGWILGLTCAGDDTCGRKFHHLPHDYVKPCWCRETNRTYARKHAAQQQLGAK